MQSADPTRGLLTDIIVVAWSGASVPERGAYLSGRGAPPCSLSHVGISSKEITFRGPGCGWGWLLGDDDRACALVAAGGCKGTQGRRGRAAEVLNARWGAG